MKKKATAIAVLALVLMLSLVQVSVADTVTSDSKSNVLFKTGTITIDPEPDNGEVGFQPMSINFGERNIPIRAETYYADGNADSVEGLDQGGGLSTEPIIGVLIADSRAKTLLTGWNYKVKMGQFIADGSNPSFNVTLFLRSGTAYTNGDTSKIGTALRLENAGSYEIKTDNQNVLVLSATSALGKGLHGARWEKQNIGMTLGQGGQSGGFTVITDDNYKAKLTWTLETI